MYNITFCIYQYFICEAKIQRKLRQCFILLDKINKKEYAFL
ncbi:hypothetical protein HMPREF3218_0201923 [Prevotella bivia]|nr:hypothetical protein HMPREF3218_0201923 [Prevotella bivia]